MSEIEVQTRAGVVVCGAEAAACHCVLALGHEGPHECSPDPCDGAWTGTWDGNDFEVVRLPRPVRGW